MIVGSSGEALTNIRIHSLRVMPSTRRKAVVIRFPGLAVSRTLLKAT
jgi:hypothetical protein